MTALVVLGAVGLLQHHSTGTTQVTAVEVLSEALLPILPSQVEHYEHGSGSEHGGENDYAGGAGRQGDWGGSTASMMSVASTRSFNQLTCLLY